jgi:hypothetical protein
MISLEECGRKLLLRILRHCTGISVEKLSKITESLRAVGVLPRFEPGSYEM